MEIDKKSNEIRRRRKDSLKLPRRSWKWKMWRVEKSVEQNPKSVEFLLLDDRPD